MKIGYLISGHPKTYRECIETFNSNLKGINTDVYSHIWWDDSHKGKCYKMHFRETLGEDDLANALINSFSINRFSIENGRSFDITFFKKFTKNAWGENTEDFYRVMTPIVLHGLLSQTYSVYQSYLLSMKNNYDVIIKSRPDLILTRNLSNILGSLPMSDNRIFFQSSVNGGHLYAGEFPNKPCDWFFLGGQKAMGIFIKSWHDEISQKCINGIIHTNELVKHVCDKNGLEINLVDFGAHIYKQATNYYDLYHNKAEIYINDFDFEKCKPQTESIWPYWIDSVNFKHFKDINF